MVIFSSTLLDIAADNIPKTSPFPKRKAKPWFDEDCQAAKKERNEANRLANKHPSAANSMRARLIQARTKKLFKQKKRDSWKNYVSSVNVNTPSKKVWDMIRKITGKNVASPMHHLKDENGTLITDRVEIANTLGAAIEKSSSNNIVKQVDPGVECSLYVDDFVIMYKSPTIDAIQRKLQYTINRLEKWTLQNGFTISKNKTVAMHFCPDKKCMDPVLKLDNDPIQFVKEAKFLGLIWDTNLPLNPILNTSKHSVKNH